MPRLLKIFCLLPMIIPGLLIAVSCSSSEDVMDIQAEESQTGSIRAVDSSIDFGQKFKNDLDLQQLLTSKSLMIPERFESVVRVDREPILSLGLVEEAARLTMLSAITREIITFDLLRLEQDVNGEEFFTAFANSMTSNSTFREIRVVGIRRGIGEYARRYAFTIGEDEAESAAFLRHGVIALIGYRAPNDLRYPLDFGDLIRRLDESIKTDHLIKVGVDLRSD